MASASQPFNLNYGEGARPDLTSVLNAVQWRMSAFSRIPMTDVDRGLMDASHQPHLLIELIFHFPQLCCHTDSCKPALPHNAPRRLQHTLHGLIYFGECSETSLFFPVQPDSARRAIHTFCTIHVLLQQNRLPATSSIPSGIRDEMRRPVVSLGPFASPAEVELRAFLCSLSLIGSSLVSG